MIARFIVILVAFSASAVWAQVSTATLSGYVLDPTDRAIAAAKVQVADSNQGKRWLTTTDTSGFYRLSELPPSTYDISATSPGFAKSQVQRVRLSVNSAVRVDFHVALEQRGESVTIRGTVTAVQTETSDLGNTIDPERIEVLPLNRRDFLQLAFLSPGVLPPVQDSDLSTRGSIAMHANGAREDFNNYLLDGVDNNDPDVHRYVLQPPVDAVQEFKIATGTYSAAYGRNGGGQVNVVTRSGGNAHHGFAYEYLRNQVLDARNYFDAGEAAKYIRSQFGGGIGGPIVHDRAFYFANVDGLRERQGLSRLATVPTLAERSGNFSGSSVPVKDPFTQAPFPGGTIPSTRISPVAQKIVSLFPLPNGSGAAGNFLGHPVLRDTPNQANAKADYRPTGTDQLSFRYSYGDRDLFEPLAEDAADVPGFGDYLRDTGHNAMVHHVRTVGPRTVNSLLLGFNRAVRRLLPQNYDTNVARQWGVSWLPSDPSRSGYPAINVAGYSTVGDITSLPIDRTATTYQLTETVSLVRGQHGIGLGGELRHYRHNSIQDLLGRGSLSFSGLLSNAGMSDLLLGFPTFTLQSQPFNTQTLRSTAANLFVQDDWRIRPNLILNLGLRYEYNTPPVDPTDRMSVFNLASGNLSRVGTNGVSRSGYQPDQNNLAPRVGFAWTPAPDTVIRGGYGIYYETGMAVVNTSLYFNPPYFTLQVFFPTETSLLTLQDPFPQNRGFAPAASLSSLSPDFRTAYMQQWSFNLQREVTALGVVSAAYSGSKGTHLVRSHDINQPPPAPGDLADRRPYPDFGNIMLIESGASSSYHSFQLSLNRRLTGGVGLIAAYTFSKSIDDTTAFLGTKSDPNFPQNSRNFAAERALSSFNMPHRATIAAVYRTPTRNAVLRNLEFSSIVTAQSGQPFTPLLRFDNSNTGNTGGSFGSDRPNVVHALGPYPGTSSMWFDTSAFAVPPEFTFGNAGRNIVRGPGYCGLDLAAKREFRFTEHASLAGGIQAFNLTNRTNFDLPEHYADEPAAFGRIFSAKAPRQVQLFLRLAF